MKKQIAKWILKNILIPLFIIILKEFGKSLLKYLLDLFNQKMHKWKTTEKQNAKTDEEKDIINKKWDERMGDLNKMKQDIDKNMDRIVEEAIKNSKKKIDNVEKTAVDTKSDDQKKLN